MTDKIKREWCYTQSPQVYEIAPCTCGNTDIQWSEWKKHCWCDKCQIDFIPEHNGIFDGPIPLHLCELMGIRFDRYYFNEDKIVKHEEYLNK
jgi:hypothetical protein